MGPALTSYFAYLTTLIPGLFSPGRGYLLFPSYAYVWETSPALTSDFAY